MSIPREKILDTISKVREGSPERGFEQSVDITVNFRDLDMRQPDNRVNLRISLPNSIGDQKVLVFASGDLALRARRAGADSIVEPMELDELASDKKAAKRRLKDYDIFVAEAPLMPTVGRVAGPILGPRGKMPTPVPPQAPIDTILDRERRVVILRSRERAFVKCKVGKESMSDEEIASNVETILSDLRGALKRGASNVASIYLKLTMGPAVRML
jgi:large subunit ribosomal protein L1